MLQLQAERVRGMPLRILSLMISALASPTMASTTIATHSDRFLVFSPVIERDFMGRLLAPHRHSIPSESNPLHLRGGSRRMDRNYSASSYEFPSEILLLT